MRWIQLTTIFSAASQILSTLASDKPLIPVKCWERHEYDNNSRHNNTKNSNYFELKLEFTFLVCIIKPLQV